MLTHWSQLVPDTSADIRGHEATQQQLVKAVLIVGLVVGEVTPASWYHCTLARCVL